MKRFSFLTILIVPFVLSAQERADSLRREVTIEKDFTPIVRDASKINTLPEVEASTVTRQSIQYSDWTVPAPLEARAVLLPPGGFGDPVRENLKRGYFDFGLGNYWNMAGNAGSASCRVRKTSWACGGNTARPAARSTITSSCPAMKPPAR